MHVYAVFRLIQCQPNNVLSININYSYEFRYRTVLIHCMSCFALLSVCVAWRAQKKPGNDCCYLVPYNRPLIVLYFPFRIGFNK